VAEARLIRLEGEYDLTRKDELAALFSALDGDEPVVIEMANVTYMDSSVLHELAALRLRNENQTITLTGVSPHVRRLLDVVNFDRILRIAD
jgi:anti-anti-sigma factor